MTDPIPFVKSHPSVRVRQLLASAELDVPAPGNKERALAAVTHARHASTTNFSGVALGNTVSRLIGAVTLYGSEASPWRLLVRGSVVGAAVGAMALASIVTVRWLQAPKVELGATLAAQPPSEVDVQSTTMSLEARREALLRGAAIELDAERAAAALESIDALSRLQPPRETLARITLLKAKALLRLERRDEARLVAQPLLAGAPSPEATELRALLDAQPPPAASANQP